MPFECLMTKITQTHSEYVKLVDFPKNGKVNALQYYVLLAVHWLSSCASLLNDNFCRVIALLSA